MLTSSQLQTLKTDIAVSEFSALPNTPQNAQTVAEAYNLAASPDFWVWRTNVTRAEIYHSASADSTTWSWTTYKNQNVAEQNAWTQMFMGDSVNMSLPNLRAGVSAIFTGTAQANAQRDHVLAVGRRKAKRAEKLFATGTGSTASPAVMGFEGNLVYTDVVAAWELP